MLPQELEGLWKHYLELAATRQWGQAGPLSINWQEMEAYNRMAGAQLSIWEMTTLRRIDEAVVPVLGKRIRHRITGKPDPVVIRADNPSMMKQWLQGFARTFKVGKSDQKE